ncbi:hypothetical protein, partial [Anaerorhabdus sp.]|uniref:hypothetical protein n=1 Tax=Anaerorhabdus sp. TaxID=1872524 RepID=UPI002FC80B52
SQQKKLTACKTCVSFFLLERELFFYLIRKFSTIKVTREYGLSIHQRATMIIARRSRGYQERIPRECHYFASSWKQMKRVFNKALNTTTVR